MRSERARVRRPSRLAALALLASIAALGGVFELASRVLYPKVSRIQRRFADEWEESRVIGRGERPSALIVGNSLAIQGIDMSALKRDMAGVDVARFASESTVYLDWYFGLRRLFAEGARPQVVAVGFRPRQILARGSRGDYFAHYLLAGNDVWSAMTRQQMSASDGSRVFFAHASAFLGSQVEIHKFLLTQMFPDFPKFASMLHGTAQPPIDDAAVAAATATQLGELERLCHAYGAKLVAWIPPSAVDVDTGMEAVVRGARSVGVEVMIPIADHVLPGADFSDGFHLAPAGAAKFTPALAESLRARLANLRD